MSAKRVLIVPMRWPLAERLRADGHVVVEADTPEDAVERADAGVDVVLLDLKMPESQVLATLAGIRERDPDPPIILIARRDDAGMVTTALASGAFDYAYEPIDDADLARRVVRAFEVTRLRRELGTLRDRLSRPFTLASLIGPSLAMQRVRDVAGKVARSEEATVLITGARGSGKDHVARVIHYTGGRAMRPFLKVQCSGRSDDALEAELFGREPVAGSDVGVHARGVFDEAHEGTLFLDDIGALNPHLQSLLLRYLEATEFRRVGGSTAITADVRIIAATQASLEAAVDAGTFRRDLFYRLNVLPVDLPTLAAHVEDVPDLARHFVAQNRRHLPEAVSGISDSAATKLLAYNWPGNVDELRSVIDRAVMLTRGPVVDASDLRGLGANPSRDMDSDAGFSLPAGGCDLEAVEKSLVLQALDRAGGNQTKAAVLLGVHRDHVRYRLTKYKKESS